MIWVAFSFAVLAGLFHVVAFIAESLIFNREGIWRTFGARSADEARVLTPVFFNQGVYNLMLALGAFVAATLVVLDGRASMFIYVCLFMMGAAIVLFVSSPRLWRGALLQGVPPALALAALALADHAS